jgi:TRAP-type C4-dicarboxylate transport system substrate-binding protein
MRKGATMNTWGKQVAIVAACGAVLVGCSDDGNSTKAGGGSPPMTLRIGTADQPGFPGADQIEEFARHVEELSEGRVRIEPAWRVAEEIEDWDQVVGRKVVSGELDMGLIPAQAWDTEGVTSLRALHAPFLVTSDELVRKVVTSDLAATMLAGLDAVDLTGLALLPEGMRHLFVFGDGDVDLFDLDGKVVRAPTSETTSALFEAFGATADDLDGQNDRFLAGARDGSVAAAESEFALAGCCLPMASTAAANLTLFPKVNSLVISTEAYESLGEDLQQVLRDAADRTLEWAVAAMPSEADQVAEFCNGGGTIVNAPESELAAMQAAVAPVYAELERDETTKQLIERIQAIKAELPTPRAIAPCGPAATSGTAHGDETTVFPDGVYRMEITAEFLMAAGVDRANAFEHAGTWTLTFKDGAFLDSDDENPGCPGSTYTVEVGRVTIHMGDQSCGTAAGDVLFSAGWTLEDDQLQFTDVRSGHGSDLLIATLFGGQPFTKID